MGGDDEEEGGGGNGGLAVAEALSAITFSLLPPLVSLYSVSDLLYRLVGWLVGFSSEKKKNL